MGRRRAFEAREGNEFASTATKAFESRFRGVGCQVLIVLLQFHGDSDDDDDDISVTPPNDESDQDDDDVTLTMLKGNKLGRGGTREIDDVVEGFSTAEVRRFVRSFRKFADPVNRLVTMTTVFNWLLSNMYID